MPRAQNSLAMGTSCAACRKKQRKKDGMRQATDGSRTAAPNAMPTSLARLCGGEGHPTAKLVISQGTLMSLTARPTASDPRACCDGASMSERAAAAALPSVAGRGPCRQIGLPVGVSQSDADAALP